MENNKVKVFTELVKILLAILASLFLALLIILCVSKEPFHALQEFFLGPLGSFRRVSQVIEMSIPFVFTGLAFAVIIKANQFNMGIEGSFFFGAFGALVIALMVPMPFVLHPMVAIAVAGIFGAAITGIPAFFKAKWGASELVSSLMMNYIVLYFVYYMINYHFRDTSAASMVSILMPNSVLLPKLLSQGRIHVGLLIAVVTVVIIYLFMQHTRWGYQLRMTGHNSQFANYSGINTFKVVFLSQVLGGFLAGIGGGIELLGMHTRFEWSALPQYGFDGIVVSLIAKNNPLFIPIAALFLAYLRVGADIMGRNSDVTPEIIMVIQAVMIMLVVAQNFLAKWQHKMVIHYSKKQATALTKEGGAQ